MRGRDISWRGREDISRRRNCTRQICHDNIDGAIITPITDILHSPGLLSSSSLCLSFSLFVLSRLFLCLPSPSPLSQIKLLQVLALLGTSDRIASEAQYEILLEVLKRADIGITIGYAVLCECVRTIATIHASQALLEVLWETIVIICFKRTAREYTWRSCTCILVPCSHNCISFARLCVFFCPPSFFCVYFKLSHSHECTISPPSWFFYTPSRSARPPPDRRRPVRSRVSWAARITI